MLTPHDAGRLYVTRCLGGPLMACQRLPGGRYRCGGCRRGVLIPREREVCRVCRASVITVLQGAEPPKRQIPPAGTVATTVEVGHVPHGWDVLVSVRSLRSELRGEPIHYPDALAFAWAALSRSLRRFGYDLTALVAQLPPSKPREAQP